MTVKLKDLVAQHNLNSNSLVVDIGGYVGDYTQEVLDQFGCRVILFEPNPDCFSKCAIRFHHDSRVDLFDLAVGSQKTERMIFLKGESTSFFSEWAKDATPIKVKEFPANELLQDLDIDVLKINCEGSEYEILKDLDNHGLLKNCKEILIQFHKVGGSIKEARKILSKTHNCVYSLKWDIWKKT